MTVSSSTVVRARFTCTGGTLYTLPASFKFFQDADLDVYRISAAGVSTLLTLTTDYSVAGGGGGTGTVTTVNTYSDGEILVLLNLDAVQDYDMIQGDGFLPDELEKQIDRFALLSRSVNEKISRCLKFGESSEAVEPFMEDPIPGHALRWDSLGEKVENFLLSLGEISSANLQQIPGITTLQAVPTGALADGTMVYLSYRAEAGDGGHGVAWWDSTPRASTVAVDTLHGYFIPPNTDTTGASGCWRIPYCDSLKAERFGKLPGGGLNDHVVIQACLDLAMYLKLPYADLPDGVFETSDTLHVGYGESFRKIVLRGTGQRHTDAASFPGSMIKVNFSDRPAVAISGGRGSTVEGMSIWCNEGLTYVDTENLGNLDLTAYDDTNISAWIPPTFAATANSQYAPFAGIAIDPYAGVAPLTHYPDVTFPSWLSGTAQYGKNYSSRAPLKDVYISGFVVGVAVQPCDADGNGDFVTFEDVTIDACAYDISVGNSQARNMNFYGGCTFARSHTFITNRTHGRQMGKINGNFTGISLGQMIQVFDIITPYADFSMLNCYAEAIWRLGFIAPSGANDKSLSFRDCEFGFSNQTNNYRGTPKYLVEGLNSAPLIFQGGALTGFRGLAAFGPLLQVNGTFIRSEEYLANYGAMPAYFAYLHSATGGVVQADQDFWVTKTDLKDVKGMSNNLWTPAGTLATARVGNDNPDAAYSGSPLCLSSRSFIDNLNGAPRPTFIFQMAYVNRSTTPLTYSSGLTFTVPVNFVSWAPKLDLGDILLDTSTSTFFVVQSVSAGVATCLAVTNYRGTTLNEGLSTSVGYMKVRYCSRYIPGKTLVGDVTSASAVITNIPSGVDMSKIKTGDYIFLDTGGVPPFSQSPSIIALDATARTITVDRNANYTQARFSFDGGLLYRPNLP